MSSFDIPKPNRSGPQITVQSAEPSTQQCTEQEPSGSPPRRVERLYNGVDGYNIPDGMTPPGKRREMQYRRKAEEDENFKRLLKLGALATGIGLGVLLAKKGYDYMWPVINKTTGDIVKEATASIDVPYEIPTFDDYRLNLK